MRANRVNVLTPGFRGKCGRSVIASFPNLVSPFAAGLSPRDWVIGNSYPVTAAQLFPIFTGFLAPVCL
jgi:hypothetical protein